MARDYKVEALLKDEQVAWDFEPALPIAAIDVKKSLLNQARTAEALTPEIVDRYALAARRGADFPAIVVRREGPTQYVVLGGNHRVAAYRKLRRDVIEAYVVKSETKATIERVTWRLNYVEGRAPTMSEAIAHAIMLMLQHGLSREAAAAAVGVRATQVKSAYDREALRRRALKLGCTIPRTKDVLDAVRGVQSDTLFMALVAAANTSGMKEADVRDLRDAAVAAGDEPKGLEVIREAMAKHKLPTTTTGRQRTQWHQVVMHVAALERAMERTPSTGLGVNAAHLKEYADRCEAIALHLRSGVVTHDVARHGTNGAANISAIA